MRYLVMMDAGPTLGFVACLRPRMSLDRSDPFSWGARRAAARYAETLTARNPRRRYVVTLAREGK